MTISFGKALLKHIQFGYHRITFLIHFDVIIAVNNVLIFLTRCHLKVFSNSERFHFQAVFLSLPCSVELKVVLGRLRHPVASYVTVFGLALVTIPFFSLYQLFEQLLEPLDLLTSCVSAFAC